MILTFTKRLSALALLSFGLSAAASAQTIIRFTPTQAKPGDNVTITGTGLNKLTSVMLNGQPMRVISSSAVQVQVVVPPAVATGRLRLTTANGTVLTSSKLGILRQSSAVSYAQKSTDALGMTAAGNFSTPTVGDLDHDGSQELLLGQGNGTILALARSTSAPNGFQSTGTLLKADDGTTLNVGPSNAGGHYAKPTFTDLDGNGLLELLVGEDTGTVLRYEQTKPSGSGALIFTRSLLFANPYGPATNSSPNAGSYARPTIADLDNDGLLDVLVGSNDGTLRRYEQTAPNALTFTALGQMKDDKGAVIDAGSVDKPLLTDYNGDGYLDMLLGNQAGAIVLYTQTGSDAVTFRSLGNLTTDGSTVISMSGANGFAAPTVTDIDGNGLLDLFVGNGTGTVYRFEQNQSATIPTLVAPLPVELAAFTGQTLGSGNQLNWTTASEVNSAYFGLERSADGVTFAQVGQVAAAGSSATTRAYQYLDATPLAGTSYYRLRQVDQDGTLAYSPTVALTRPATLGTASPVVAQAFPTRFDTELNVVLPQAPQAQAATVQLLAADGRPVYSQPLTLSATPLALPALPALAPGLYLLRIATAAGTSTLRVVRQ